MSSGDVVEVSQDQCKVVDHVQAGAILVDGLGVGDVGNIVLRDRQNLAQNGIIIVVLTLEKYCQSASCRAGYRIQRLCLCERIRGSDGRGKSRWYRMQLQDCLDTSCQ